MFTAHVDDARATVRARGRLDPLTADLLHRTLQTLRQRGHHHITVDVRDLTEIRTADRHLLTGLVEDLAAGGLRLTFDDGTQPRDPATVAALPIPPAPGITSPDRPVPGPRRSPFGRLFA